MTNNYVVIDILSDFNSKWNAWSAKKEARNRVKALMNGGKKAIRSFRFQLPFHRFNNN